MTYSPQKYFFLQNKNEIDEIAKARKEALKETGDKDPVVNIAAKVEQPSANPNEQFLEKINKIEQENN